MRILQVGLGGWGRDWFSNILSSRDDIEIVALVDPVFAEGQDAALPVPQFASLKLALESVEFDAALVTVGIRWHAAVARTLLEAGHHVLLEKPFCTSLDEAVELVELAERMGVQLTIAHNYRHFAAARIAKSLVAAGELGRVRRTGLVFRKVGRDVHTTGSPEDRSLLVQLSVHHFDLMRSVLGVDASRIVALTDAPGEVTETSPTSVIAAIEMADGSVVSYDATNRSPTESTPWSGSWTIELERGVIVWGSGDLGEPGRASVVVRRPGAPEEAIDLARIAESDRFAVLTSFIESVRAGVPAETSGRDNLQTMAMLDAALRSAITGAAADVRRT